MLAGLALALPAWAEDASLALPASVIPVRDAGGAAEEEKPSAMPEAEDLEAPADVQGSRVFSPSQMDAGLMRKVLRHVNRYGWMQETGHPGVFERCLAGPVPLAKDGRVASACVTVARPKPKGKFIPAVYREVLLGVTMAFKRPLPKDSEGRVQIWSFILTTSGLLEQVFRETLKPEEQADDAGLVAEDPASKATSREWKDAARAILLVTPVQEI